MKNLKENKKKLKMSRKLFKKNYKFKNKEMMNK